MKKIYFAAAAIFICIFIYIVQPFSSQASNTSYKYEYYYNDNALSQEEDDAVSISNQAISGLTPDTTTIKTAALDTTPSSLTVFVNKEYSLPKDYIPADLVIPDVLFNINHYDEKKLLRQEAATALEQLFQSAQEDHIILCGISGYRSYKRQNEIYTKNIATKGAAYTNQYSAKPGYSEHQTGWSIDVSASCINYRLDAAFGGTPEGQWLAKHCHLFGFIIRYPENKSEITGYAYEPWHIRYVGVELATYLMKNELTLEEYYSYKPSIDLVNDTTTPVDVEDADTYIPPIATAPPATDKPSKTTTPIITKEPTVKATKVPAPTKKPVKTTKAPLNETTSPSIAPKKTIPPTAEPKKTATPATITDTSETEGLEQED